MLEQECSEWTFEYLICFQFAFIFSTVFVLICDSILRVFTNFYWRASERKKANRLRAWFGETKRASTSTHETRRLLLQTYEWIILCPLVIYTLIRISWYSNSKKNSINSTTTLIRSIPTKKNVLIGEFGEFRGKPHANHIESERALIWLCEIFGMITLNSKYLCAVFIVNTAQKKAALDTTQGPSTAKKCLCLFTWKYSNETEWNVSPFGNWYTFF